MLFKNKRNWKIVFKTQISLNPIEMNIFATIKIIFFYNTCKETQETRDLIDLNRTSYFEGNSVWSNTCFLYLLRQ